MRRPLFFFETEGGASGGTGGAAPAAGATLMSGEGGAAPAAGATLMSGEGGAAPAAGAATGAAAPTPAWIGADGSLQDGWLQQLPEDLRSNASLTVIKSLPDLAKSYVTTKGLVGKKLEMPGEGATPEQVASWRKVTGAPEKPEGYLGEAKTVRPEAIPEQYWNGDAEKKFLEVAHKHSLPPAAVKDILATYGEHFASQLKAVGEQESSVLQAEGVKLRTAWGADFDSKVQLASRMAQTVGLDPKTHPIFTNADVVQAFEKMGRLISEDKLVKGDNASISATIADRVRDITDPKSQSSLAREYRGEFGPERQQAAQQQLHGLYAAQKAS